MAEAIGVAGSIAGLAQIAGGVFRIAFKFIKDVKDAKSHIKTLVDELQIFSGVLHRLTLLVESLEVQDDNTQGKLFSRQIRSCRKTLSKIERPLLAACRDFETNTTRTWKHQLKWPFDKGETNELLLELNRHKETLNLALTADSISTMLRMLSDQKDVDELIRNTNHVARAHMDVTTRIVADQNRFMILDYFLKWDPQPIFTQALQEHHPSTGLWLTDSDEFIQWSETPGSKIWLTGIPGAGKTVLAAAMLESLIQMGNDRTGVAFFFCAYSEPRTHDAVNILCTLAAQIARQSPGAFNLLREYYEELHPNNKLSRSADITRLTALLISMCNQFDQVVIVVDGLDECRDKVLDVLKALTGLTHQYSSLSLALLSRDEPSIRGSLMPDFKAILIAAHEDDLQQYTVNEIENRIRKRQLRLKNTGLKDKIITALVEGADGILHNDKARQEALRSLPPGLNATYERILDSISNTDKHVCLLVSRVLLLITFASPCLTIPELCGALAACDDIDEYDRNVEIDEEEIAFQCTSLIRKSANGKSFELAHFTVREFLQQKVQDNLKFAQYYLEESRAMHLLLECSLRFLLLKNFARHPEEAFEEQLFVAHRNEQYPFYEYASMSIPVLAIAPEKHASIIPLMMRLFDARKSANFTSWTLELLRHHRDGSWSSWVGSRSGNFRSPTPLTERMASPEPGLCYPQPNVHVPLPGPVFGHGPNCLEENHTGVYLGGPVCDVRFYPNLVHLVRHSSFSTLHVASLLGLTDVCREIIATDDTQVNVSGRLGTPLHCALGGPSLLSGHGLLRIRDDATIFQWPRMETVELLIGFGGYCSAEMVTSAGVLTVPLLALFISCLLEDFRILERILREEPSLDEILKVLEVTSSISESPLLQEMNAKLTSSGATVLHIMDSIMVRIQDDAKKMNYGKIMGQLRSRGCSDEGPFSRPFITSNNLCTNVELAIRYDDVQWLEHLLASSAEGCAMAKTDQLPTLAFEQQAEVSFRFLISNNACEKLSSDAADELLLRCCTNKRKGLLRCLLESDVGDIRAVDRYEDTIYHLAAKEGSDEILKCLLAHGMDVTEGHPLQMMNRDRRTPLAEALFHNQDACAAVIIRSRETDKSILQCINPSLSTLIANVQSTDTIQMLAEADLLPGVEGGSPLHCIDWFSNPNVLRCLLSIYPYTQSSDGMTPMEIFSDYCLRMFGNPGVQLSEARMKAFELLAELELSYTSQNLTSQGLWEKFATRLRRSHGSEESALMIFKAALRSGAIAAYEAIVDKNAISEFEPMFTVNETHINSHTVADLMIPILESSAHLEWFQTESAIQALRWSVIIGSTKNVQYLVPRILNMTDPDRLNGLTSTGEGLGLLHLASSRAYPPDIGSLNWPEDRGALRHALCRVFDVPWPQHSEHSERPEKNEHLLIIREGALRYLYGLPILSPEDIEAVYYHYTGHISSVTGPSAIRRAPRLSPERIESIYHHYTERKSSVTTPQPTIHEILLCSGLDPNRRSRETEISPLSMHLCMNAPLAVLETLVNYAARYDSSSADKYGWTPIAWACLLGRLDFLQYLMDAKKCTDLWGWEAEAQVRFHGAKRTVEFVRCTALHLAVLSRDIKVVEFVLTHMDLDVSTMHGSSDQCTPLHLALEQEEIEVPGLLSMLVHHGADVNAQGPHKWSPLHSAAIKGDVDTASFLIDNGAISAADRYGRTPMYYALKNKHYAIALVVAGLKDAGENPQSMTNTKLRNAMADAFQGFIEDDDLDACQSLVHIGCSPNIRMPYCHHCTPLLYALWLGRTAIVDWLLREGADIHCTACQGATIWKSSLITSSDGRTKKNVYPSMTILDMMLWKDEFWDLLPQWLSLMSELQFRWLAQNSTAVHVAIQRCSIAGLRILLSHAACLEDDFGNTLSKNLANSFFPDYQETTFKKSLRTTPLNRAICLRNSEAAKILIDYGADISASHYQSPSALHLAAENGSFEILEYILRTSVMINAPNRQGQSALSLAITNNRNRCAKLLLERGASIQDSLGSSISALLKANYKRAMDLFLDSNYNACSEYTWTISEVLAHVLSYKLERSTARQSHIIAANHSFLMKIPVSLLKYYWANYCKELLSEQLVRWDVRGLACGPQGAKLLFERIDAAGEPFSALCYAASFDLLPVVEGLLRAGFSDEFIDAELGSPLMAALRSGQKEVVKFLVRRGCSLTGIGDIVMKVAMHFPDILDWLFVQRFIEQGKLTASGEDKGPQVEKPWCGLMKLRFPLLGNHRQEWGETEFEYTTYLHRLRQEITDAYGIHSTAALANQPRRTGFMTGYDPLYETDNVSEDNSGTNSVDGNGQGSLRASATE